MNIRDNFEGTGISQTWRDELNAEIASNESEALMQEGLAEDLAKELPTPTGTDKDRGIFERSIAARRQEKAKQQAIAAAAMAKARALTLSIRSMEDALDGLLVSDLTA